MLSPYSDSNIIYKRFLRASHSRNRTPLRIPDSRPAYSGLLMPLIGSISCLQAVRNTSYECTYISHLSHRELIWSANLAMSLLVMTPSLLVTSANRRLAEANSLSKTPVTGFVFFFTATGAAS